jgi:hypothetical protein
MLLHRLPRGGVLVRFRPGDGGGQGVKPAGRVLDLAVHQTHPLGHFQHMRAGGFRRAGRDGQGGAAQLRQRIIRREPANAVRA